MSTELKQIKSLLNSTDKANQELALTLVEGLNLDIEIDLPDHYVTYQFLVGNSKFTKEGLTNVVEILKELQSTTGLWYSYNSIEGELVDFQLPNLKHLYFDYNEFSGSIPDFTGLPSLKELSLDHNLLTGKLPNFSNLPNLEALYLYHNELTGLIPNFSNLPKLKEINLSTNELTGDIPEFENLPKLERLDLSFNSLDGEISTKLKSRLKAYYI